MHRSKQGTVFTVLTPNTDRSRFSQLFINMIHSEFQRQSNPSLRTLISDYVSSVGSVSLELISDVVQRGYAVYNSMWDL
jgi:hypothetical protein